MLKTILWQWRQPRWGLWCKSVPPWEPLETDRGIDKGRGRGWQKGAMLLGTILLPMSFGQYSLVFCRRLCLSCRIRIDAVSWIGTLITKIHVEIADTSPCYFIYNVKIIWGANCTYEFLIAYDRKYEGKLLLMSVVVSTLMWFFCWGLWLVLKINTSWGNQWEFIWVG